MRRHGLPTSTKPSSLRCCDTCRHWRKHLFKRYGPVLFEVGLCVRRAPIAGTNASPVWPSTASVASCGEWEAQQ
jgi:hypothetical protein